MIDAVSCAIYRAMGFTHFVVVPNVDPRLPPGHKTVRYEEERDLYVDENGREYSTAEVLPF